MFQDVLFNVDISAMYADADAVVRIAKVNFNISSIAENNPQ